jgi:chromosome segregation ATPase
MAQTQSPNLDQLSQDVRARLANIDSSLKSLKTKVDGDANQADAELRTQLAKVSADLESNKPQLAAAEAQLTQWVQTQKAATTQRVAEWKASQDFPKREARAAEAERSSRAQSLSVRFASSV